MDIVVRLYGFRERSGVILLNWLAHHNRRLLEENPRLPLLYDSGVVYRRERVETWSDAVMSLQAGHEDCDALSAWRAGEILARGWRALGPTDGGFAEASRTRLDRLDAEVLMTTRTRPGKSGLYHCIVRYRVGNQWFRDDPSARLGMYAGRVDTHVLARWRRHGVTARAPLETR